MTSVSSSCSCWPSYVLSVLFFVSRDLQLGHWLLSSIELVLRGLVTLSLSFLFRSCSRASLVISSSFYFFINSALIFSFSFLRSVLSWVIICSLVFYSSS